VISAAIVSAEAKQAVSAKAKFANHLKVENNLPDPLTRLSSMNPLFGRNTVTQIGG